MRPAAGWKLRSESSEVIHMPRQTFEDAVQSWNRVQLRHMPVGADTSCSRLEVALWILRGDSALDGHPLRLWHLLLHENKCVIVISGFS